MIHPKAGTGNYQNEKMANADTRPVPALIMHSAKIRATKPYKVAVLPEWMRSNGYLPETDFRDERYVEHRLKTAFL